MGMIQRQAQSSMTNPVQMYFATAISVTGTGMGAQVTIASPISGANITLPYVRANTPNAGDTVLVFGTGVSTDEVVACARSTFTPGPSGAYCIAIDPSGTYAYIGDLSSATITKVALSTFTVVGSIAATLTPVGIAIDPTGSFAYITGYSGGIEKINLSTFSTVSTIYSGGSSKSDIKIDPTGGYAYTHGIAGGSYIYQYNLSTFALVTAHTVGWSGGLSGLAINPAGTYVYGGQPAYGYIVAGAIPAFTSVAETAYIYATAPNPNGKMAINPAGTYMFVPCTNGILKVTLPAASVFSMAVTGLSFSGIVIDPSGTYMYAWTAGNVYQISLSAYTSSAPLTTGVLISDAAIDPTGNYLYVTDQTNGSLTKIAIPSFTVVNTILA